MAYDEDIAARIAQLDDEIKSDSKNSSLFFARGKLHWKLGNRGAAMSDFATAVNLDPGSPAKEYLDMTRDIMDYYNTDLYNP